MTKKEAFIDAFETCYRTITAFSISECDTQHRQDAMDTMSRVRELVIGGVKISEMERERDENKRIVAAYREGRLTGTL